METMSETIGHLVIIVILILVVCAGFTTINYIKSLFLRDREGAMYRALKKLADGDHTKTFTLDDITVEARMKHDEALRQINKLRVEGIVWTVWLHEGKRYGLER